MIINEKFIDQEDVAVKSLVQETKADFEMRQQAKRCYEAQWLLNMNFLMGNQYCDINGNIELTDSDKKYLWQENECYNHIASIIERRIAQLSKVRPKINIIPASSDEDDIKTATISKKVIDSAYNSTNLSKVISNATRWSEVCGSAFYKISWNNSKGQIVGYNNKMALHNGDVEISAVSPFEIFPENFSTPDLKNQKSIIHAKAYHKDEVKNKWGIDVEGENVNIMTLKKDFTSAGVSSCMKSAESDYVIVIEKYELPSIKYPNGRFIVIANDKLITYSDLPFVNGSENRREFPFVKQDAFLQAGSFWGTSVVERLIPLQKAYNALKNRKHEIFNRYSIGVLAVEDGSVDVDNLEDEGLQPGKVLVYRQGANAPKFMQNENMPWDFIEEEKLLLEEFAKISGISDMLTEEYSKKQLSGIAIELLMEQDESRIQVSIDSIKDALKEIAKQILMLYKNNVAEPRLAKIVGNNGSFETFYFSKSDISSEDVVFDVKNEITDSHAKKRQLIFELLDKGLFYDENNKISPNNKFKIMEALGFGNWETIRDLNDQHKMRAEKENFLFTQNENIEVREIDNHQIHIDNHISFVISGEFDKLNDKKLEAKIIAHINEHKKFLNEKE